MQNCPVFQVERGKWRKNRSMSGFPGRGQQCNIIWDVCPPGGLFISLSATHQIWVLFFTVKSLPRQPPVPLSLHLPSHVSYPSSFFLFASYQHWIVCSCHVFYRVNIDKRKEEKNWGSIMKMTAGQRALREKEKHKPTGRRVTQTKGKETRSRIRVGGKGRGGTQY